MNIITQMLLPILGGVYFMIGLFLMLDFTLNMPIKIKVKHIIGMTIFLPFTIISLVVHVICSIVAKLSVKINNSKLGDFLNKPIKK